MYVRTTIDCGFCHQFNNDRQLNELVELMKKNPDAKFNFELSHLGQKPEKFVFEIENIEDDEYGYYICTQFSVNRKGIVSWDAREKDIPWGVIWSKLYNIIVSLCRYGYDLEETS